MRELRIVEETGNLLLSWPETGGDWVVWFFTMLPARVDQQRHRALVDSVKQLAALRFVEVVGRSMVL
jgi:hypothetical protein